MTDKTLSSSFSAHLIILFSVQRDEIDKHGVSSGGRAVGKFERVLRTNDFQRLGAGARAGATSATASHVLQRARAPHALDL